MSILTFARMGSFADSFTSSSSQESDGQRIKQEVAAQKQGEAQIKLTDDDYAHLRKLSTAHGEEAEKAVKVDPAHPHRNLSLGLISAVSEGIGNKASRTRAQSQSDRPHYARECVGIFACRARSRRCSPQRKGRRISSDRTNSVIGSPHLSATRWTASLTFASLGLWVGR